ncbi:hypothetical protein C8R43DRAFT_1117987 [Mycena crocata]|nr:hypothetical protein C8R43DRAFT_1117987 [Mycena crocata]
MSSGKGKQPHRETIEIEDADARLDRIQRALEKMNTPSSAGADSERIFTDAANVPQGSGSGGDLSQLLARVQEFLPQLEASNAALAAKASADPRSVDIENVEGDEKVIHMKLGLGVFEDRTGREGDQSSSSDEDSSDSDSEMDSESSASDDSDEDSSSTGDSSDESTNETSPRQFAPLPRRALLARPVKPLPRRGAGGPEIVVLSETTTNDV